MNVFMSGLSLVILQEKWAVININYGSISRELLGKILGPVSTEIYQWMLYKKINYIHRIPWLRLFIFIFFCILQRQWTIKNAEKNWEGISRIK